MARFIQIHTLTSYPAALLNRDDVGFAKRAPFGGVVRTRISSQCLKRHWRTFEGAHALGELGSLSVRSRITFEREIVQKLIAEGVDAALVRGVVEAMIPLVLGESAKAKKAKDDAKTEAKDEGGLRTGQVTVLGRPEIEYLLGHARAVCADKPDAKKIGDAVKARLKDAKKNLDAMRQSAGLDAALFGRMVTSDILSRGDAALHVAHALTVHESAAETDYFTAVDDLLRDGDDEQLGSGHLGTTELTSGLFYGYVVVDLPLLVSNLEGCARKDWSKADRALAGRVVESLVHLVAKVSPGAKLGSTAPHSYASLVLVEAGDEQPRTLANAFLEPVRVAAKTPDLLGGSYAALARHVADLDRTYGVEGARRYAALGARGSLTASLGEGASLAEVATWAGGVARGQ
jgi:CRISPR system Cascade subunit CasC